MHRLISSRSSEPVHAKCTDTLAAVNVTVSKRGGYAAHAAICLTCAYETGLPKKLREISAETDILPTRSSLRYPPCAARMSPTQALWSL